MYTIASRSIVVPVRVQSSQSGLIETRSPLACAQSMLMTTDAAPVAARSNDNPVDVAQPVVYIPQHGAWPLSSHKGAVTDVEGRVNGASPLVWSSVEGHALTQATSQHLMVKTVALAHAAGGLNSKIEDDNTNTTATSSAWCKLSLGTLDVTTPIATHVNTTRCSEESALDPCVWTNKTMKVILGNVLTATLVVSADNTVLECNQRAATIFGYTMTELRGTAIERLIDITGSRDGVCGPVAKKADGTTIAVHVVTQARRLHASHVTLWSITDISARMTAVQQVITEEAAGREKIRMHKLLSTLGHEIRTPLVGIIGYMELLLPTTPSLVDTPQQRALECVSSCAEAILDTITNVIDYTKLDMGSITLEQAPFSPSQVAASIASRCSPALRLKGLTVSTAISDTVPSTLVGDAARYNQVLSQLCSNAIKFTPMGEIKVQLSASMEENGLVRLVSQISDTGIGMSSLTVKHLFEPFTQGDDTATRKYGGCGLGLVICKLLGELMHGSICVSSVPGEGSVVTFEAMFATASSSCYNVANTCVLPHRVLLVEDDGVSRNVTQRLLHKLHIEVVTAVNGKDALDKLCTDVDFDVILMDCEMPRMNGFQATEAIRQDTRIAAIRIIAMTANTMSGDRKRCLQNGMDDYIAKPFRLQELQARLQRHT
jgi:signal transduction histidine kinase/CheY-like chemotaxis protein